MIRYVANTCCVYSTPMFWPEKGCWNPVICDFLMQHTCTVFRLNCAKVCIFFKRTSPNTILSKIIQDFKFFFFKLRWPTFTWYVNENLGEVLWVQFFMKEYTLTVYTYHVIMHHIIPKCLYLHLFERKITSF